MASWRRRLTTPALIAVATVASWPVRDPTPHPGLDPSWQVGLHMAADAGLEHGREIVWTYGPLGFMHSPLTVAPGEYRLAFLYTLITHTALCTALIWLGTRSFGRWPAFVLAIFAASLPHLDTVVALALLLAVICHSPKVGSWATPLLVFGGGVLAGLEALAKLNSGLAATLIVAVGVALLPGSRVRNLTLFTATAVGAVLVLWLAAGQPPRGLVDYVSVAPDVVGGYSQAMLDEQIGRSWEYWAGAALAATLLALAWRNRDVAQGGGAGSGLVVPLLLLLVMFLEFKAGFVRHDSHSTIFFSALVVAWFALPWRRKNRGLAAATLVAVSIGFIGALGAGPPNFVMPLGRAAQAFEQAHSATVPGRLQSEISAARANLRRHYHMDTETQRLLTGRTVHVHPVEAAIVWAYGFTWKPAPVFGAYQAYTRRLDALNASALASPGGPERVLRQPGAGAIDQRHPAHEPPAGVVALLCHFRVVRTTPRWQVLARTRDRCGSARRLDSATVAPGQVVPVPRARDHEAVLVRIEGAGPSGLESLRTVLFKAHERRISLPPAGDFRLVPGTAEDGLLLRVPPDADFGGDYAVSPAATALAVRRVVPGGQPMRLTFYAVAMAGNQ